MNSKLTLSVEFTTCGCSVISISCGDLRKNIEDSCVVFFSAPVCSVTDGLFDIAVSLLKGEDCIKTVFQLLHIFMI